VERSDVLPREIIEGSNICMFLVDGRHIPRLQIQLPMDDVRGPALGEDARSADWVAPLGEDPRPAIMTGTLKLWIRFAKYPDATDTLSQVLGKGAGC
jgi:hypothetical protein